MIFITTPIYTQMLHGMGIFTQPFPLVHVAILEESVNQWLFLVPLKGGIGSIVHPPIGRKNTTYIPLTVLAFWGVLCYLSHLLWEPASKPLVFAEKKNVPGFLTDDQASEVQGRWTAELLRRRDAERLRLCVHIDLVGQRNAGRGGDVGDSLYGEI